MLFEYFSELGVSEGQGMIDNKDSTEGWDVSRGSDFEGLLLFIVHDFQKLSTVIGAIY